MWFVGKRSGIAIVRLATRPPCNMFLQRLYTAPMLLLYVLYRFCHAPVWRKLWLLMFRLASEFHQVSSPPVHVIFCSLAAASVSQESDCSRHCLSLPFVLPLAAVLQYGDVSGVHLSVSLLRSLFRRLHVYMISGPSWYPLYSSEPSLK